jgi:hypothetical protein
MVLASGLVERTWGVCWLLRLWRGLRSGLCIVGSLVFSFSFQGMTRTCMYVKTALYSEE